MNMSETKNLWGGRFTGAADKTFTEFNRSFGFDRRLFFADIKGSIAQANGLTAAGILTADETSKVIDALNTLAAEAEADPKYFDA